MRIALSLVVSLASLVALTESAALAGGKGAVVELGGLSSRAPAGWTPVPNTQAPRHSYFILPRVPGDDRDAQLIVFYFGGGGGSAKANIARWKSLFEPPAGKSIDDVTTIKRMKIAGKKVTYVDISGTYLWKARPVDPDLEAERRPDHRMIAIVFETGEGPYFIRFFGPHKTVARHKSAFDSWLRAFR